MAAVPQDPGRDPGLALPADKPQISTNKEKVGLHHASSTAIDIDTEQKLADTHPSENDAEHALGGTPRPTLTHIIDPEEHCIGGYEQWDPREDLLSTMFINNNTRDATDNEDSDSKHGALSSDVTMQAFYAAQDANDAASTDSSAPRAAADSAANRAADCAADHAKHAADDAVPSKQQASRQRSQRCCRLCSRPR